MRFIFDALMGKNDLDVDATADGLGRPMTIAVAYTMLEQGARPAGGKQRGRHLADTLCLNWEKECLKWLDGRLRPVVITSDIKGGKGDRGRYSASLRDARPP